MGAPADRPHGDADHKPELVYEVDPTASAGALFSTSTPRFSRRRRHSPATITGHVILDESSHLIAADLHLSPRSTPVFLSRINKARWQLKPTQLTSVCVYRLDAWRYRAEVELRCEQTTARTVLSLTRWPATQSHPPNELRLSATTLTHHGAHPTVLGHLDGHDLPQLYMRLVLIPG